MKPSLILAATASLALAACGETADNDAAEPAPAETAIPVEPDGGIGDGAGPPDAVAGGSDVIPARFRGVWDYVEGNCNPASDLRIEIGETMIGFYESRGQVTDVELEGEEAMVLELAMEGEGERWTMKRRFTLEGPDRLVPSAASREESFEPMPLKRCPNGENA